MHAVFNEPTLSILIEVSTPGRGHLFHYRVDQALPRPGRMKQRDRVIDQVQTHLNDLHRRTELVYHIVYWADPARFTAYVEDNGIELS